MSEIIAVSELQKYSLNELQALYHKVQQEAVLYPLTYPLGSIEYKKLIISLQNINRIIQVRRSVQHKPREF